VNKALGNKGPRMANFTCKNIAICVFGKFIGNLLKSGGIFEIIGTQVENHGFINKITNQSTDFSCCRNNQ